jgi:hypothetical protein
MAAGTSITRQIGGSVSSSSILRRVTQSLMVGPRSHEQDRTLEQPCYGIQGQVLPLPSCE